MTTADPPESDTQAHATRSGLCRCVDHLLWWRHTHSCEMLPLERKEMQYVVGRELTLRMPSGGFSALVPSALGPLT